MLAAIAATAMATPPIVAAPPATPPALSTPAAPAGEPKAISADDGRAPLAELEDIYQQTCEGRAYGAYDDVCSQLHDQLRQAQRDDARRLDAERRRRPSARKSAPQGVAEKAPSGSP